MVDGERVVSERRSDFCIWNGINIDFIPIFGENTRSSFIDVIPTRLAAWMTFSADRL